MMGANNIELFDQYLLGQMSEVEEANFKQRLDADRQLASDFRVYLFSIRGVRQEAEQEAIEFAAAMKSLSRNQLLKIIGRDCRTIRPFTSLQKRERLAWAASVAAIVVIGIAAIFQIDRSGRNQLDNTLVAYNYTPVISKDGGEAAINILDMSSDEIKKSIPMLEREYKNTSTEDMEAAEQAGMRLAMAYLKIHDRKKAISVLTELKGRFAEDAEFTAQCDTILKQLK